jgi:hypothetical protein
MLAFLKYRNRDKKNAQVGGANGGGGGGGGRLSQAPERAAFLTYRDKTNDLLAGFATLSVSGKFACLKTYHE